MRDRRHEIRLELGDPHFARRRAGDEEDAEAHRHGEHDHQRQLRPRARADDLRNRLRPVAGAQPPDLAVLLVRRRELEQLLVEEDDREAALVDRRHVAAALGVRLRKCARRLRRGLRFRAAGSPMAAAPSPASRAAPAGMNSARKLLGIDGEGEDARHALARRAFESQLRLDVVRAAVDRFGERDDRATGLEQVLAIGPAASRQAALSSRNRWLMSPVGSRLAGVVEDQPLVGELGPRSDQTKNDSTNGLSVSASLKIGSMIRQIERLGARRGNAQQDADVRTLQVVLDRARQRLRGVAAQLTQHDRRGRLDVVQRPELEVEQHRHRDGDHHGEARRQAHTAIGE